MRVPSIVLLSGGLDSSANLALCHEYDKPRLALTVRYGQRAADAEVRAARAFCDYYDVQHRVIELPWLGELGGSSLTDSGRGVPEFHEKAGLDELAVTRESARSVWVPNRNGILINVAAAYAERLGCPRIVVGFNAEEAVTFPDNSLEFLRRASESLALSTANGAKVFCYSASWDKRQIVRELSVLPKAFPFEKVWSCYHGRASACGTCESCQRLDRALRERILPC